MSLYFIHYRLMSHYVLSIVVSDSGYLDMQPVNMLYKGAGSDLLRPDKVPSLLSDSESVEGFPKRTYSLGSKPVTTQPALGQSPAYMDMHCSLDKGALLRFFLVESVIQVMY